MISRQQAAAYLVGMEDRNGHRKHEFNLEGNGIEKFYSFNKLSVEQLMKYNP